MSFCLVFNTHFRSFRRIAVVLHSILSFIFSSSICFNINFCDYFCLCTCICISFFCSDSLCMSDLLTNLSLFNLILLRLFCGLFLHYFPLLTCFSLLTDLRIVFSVNLSPIKIFSCISRLVLSESGETLQKNPFN